MAPGLMEGAIDGRLDGDWVGVIVDDIRVGTTVGAVVDGLEVGTTVGLSHIGVDPTLR